MKPIGRNVNVKKVSAIAIVTNALQVGLVVGMVLYVLLVPHAELDTVMAKYILVIAASVVVWGAVVDIREALSTRRLLGQLDDMDSTIEALESLNNTLRAQRHDFLNHLQVVYSLMELGEYGESMKYIERTYDDILSVSGVMKTASPAINALLMSKTSDARANGIELRLAISSPYANLPMESWEMCRVLGNLLDNAIDALEGVRDGRIEVELTEDLHSYGFRVFNNGPAVRPEHRDLIFQTGFTTKSTGTGMGLHIVRTIMREHGGDVRLETGGAGTAFIGTLPKRMPAEEPCAGEQ